MWQKYVYAVDDSSNALLVFNKVTGARFKTLFDMSAARGFSIAIATSTAQPPLSSKRKT
jgi:hypothetical protein